MLDGPVMPFNSEQRLQLKHVQSRYKCRIVHRVTELY